MNEWVLESLQEVNNTCCFNSLFSKKGNIIRNRRKLIRRASGGLTHGVNTIPWKWTATRSHHIFTRRATVNQLRRIYLYSSMCFISRVGGMKPTGGERADPIDSDIRMPSPSRTRCKAGPSFWFEKDRFTPRDRLRTHVKKEHAGGDRRSKKVRLNTFESFYDRSQG